MHEILPSAIKSNMLESCIYFHTKEKCALQLQNQILFNYHKNNNSWAIDERGKCKQTCNTYDFTSLFVIGYIKYPMSTCMPTLRVYKQYLWNAKQYTVNTTINIKIQSSSKLIPYEDMKIVPP